MFSSKDGKEFLDFRIHASVTVGTKGQIVIPKDVRDMLDIHEGDVLLTMTRGGKSVGFVRTEDVKDFVEFLQQQL